MPSHAEGAVPVDAPIVADAGDHRRPGATCSTDREDPRGPGDRRRACEALVAAYGGDTYRLLTDLADLLQASVAYVDRPTVGDAGTIRTDWIEEVLLRTGVPGRAGRVSHRSSSRRHPIRR
jgi:hypothetical protein